MTWFRLDDGGTFHPKVLSAGNEAWGALCRAGQWCAKHLTDGKIPCEVAHAIAKKGVWTRLISAGLVEEIGADFYLLHDYLQWNLSREEVIAGRERKAKNIRDYRQRRKAPVERSVTTPVTGNVTGYKPATEPAGNRGPYPDPDPKREEKQNGASAPAAHTADPELKGAGDFVAIRDRIRRWPIFALLNADRLADEQAGWMLSKGQKLAWVLDSIDACATKCVDGAAVHEKHRMLVGYMHAARRPRERMDEPAPTRRVVESKEDPAHLEKARAARAEALKLAEERREREAAKKAGGDQ